MRVGALGPHQKAGALKWLRTHTNAFKCWKFGGMCANHPRLKCVVNHFEGIDLEVAVGRPGVISARGPWSLLKLAASPNVTESLSTAQTDIPKQPYALPTPLLGDQGLKEEWELEAPPTVYRA